MNANYANSLTNNKIENSELIIKEKDKIFQISKVKKYKNSNNNKSIPKTDIIKSSKKIIFTKIDKKHQNTKNISKNKTRNSIDSINKQNSLEFLKVTKKNKSEDKYLIKKSKYKSANSLKRPIFIEDSYPIENKPKNKKDRHNSVNPLENNVKSNFEVNSNINPFNINIKFPFMFNSDSKNLSINFNFMKFPMKEDLFKGNNINFQLNSNNTIINNLCGIKDNNFKKNEIFNISFGNNQSHKTTLDKKKFILIGREKKKRGRKSNSQKKLNIRCTHTKFSSDNMMKKLKNKIIESSRQLINKVLSDEILKLENIYHFPFSKFKKIKGIFSQELNIKFNLWFYQIKLKDIFSMEISNKYSSLDKNSNKELIKYIFSDENEKHFEKTKKLLNMSFHQYFHDIFLAEKKDWMKYLNIKPEDNKFELNHVLISLEEDDKNDNLNKIYVERMKKLANDYEGFFLFKKTRNVDKKNDFIKSFMNKDFTNEFSKYSEEVKIIKNYYDKRKDTLNKNKENLILENTQDDNYKFSKISEEEYIKDSKEADDFLKNIIINISNECTEQYLNRKRNPIEIDNSNL